MLRSAGLIFSGNVASAALMMVRTLLVSRLISLEDFGTASVFLLAVALVEMVSALGFQQQIAQSANGDAPEFQSALQGFSVLRGVVIAGLLVALAAPLASFFAIPHALWALYLIAILPLMSGCVHFDAYRFGRQMAYCASVWLSVLPPAVSLLSVLPLFHLFGDFRVLVYAIMVQAVLSLLISHMVATRRYRLRLDAAFIRQSFKFGWPLMISGTLMFLVFYGERGIIARHFGLEMMAIFSMALSLTLTPALVLTRSTMGFFLPQLSAALGSSGYSGLAVVILQTHLLLGCVMVICVALFGGPFLIAVLGQKYVAALPLLVWLACLMAFRVFAGGCAIAALAASHTKNEILANFVRVSLLPVAWMIVRGGGDVMTLIWIGIVGEAAGYAIGLGLVLGRQHLPLRPLILPLASAMVLLISACALQAETEWGMSAGVLAVLLALTLLGMPQLATYLRKNTATGFTVKP
ncbi:Membrane protein involved in the export of O-antigen and teichoic acid [Sulfitobacter marinus]|uniref:Membrane protein involved in the export of O-antigen and teichoic acid n=1 Tax=Sulfitobacter marinus TaxID=394264 RepID=A0A1I6VBS3_9RHOB|nr:oligosaccharide flippase family protein [Sulfitobacter marinus]SFT11176.1 Membrane protein involved in the export of O-antigen and teichoic acid [Sulfitobacter marinus]